MPQRENPIVNRLNKTKVELKPDLKQEKEDRLKELRQREQAAQQKRVSVPHISTSHLVFIPTPPRAVNPSSREANPEAYYWQRKEEARQAEEWAKKKYQKEHAYDEVFSEDNLATSSNQNRGEDWEDDFM